MTNYLDTICNDTIWARQAKIYTNAEIEEFEEKARAGGHMSECCQTTYNENQKAEICENCHCVLPEGLKISAKRAKRYTNAEIEELDEKARAGGHMKECCQKTYNESPKAEICESCDCVLPEGLRRGH